MIYQCPAFIYLPTLCLTIVWQPSMVTDPGHLSLLEGLERTAFLLPGLVSLNIILCFSNENILPYF